MNRQRRLLALALAAAPLATSLPARAGLLDALSNADPQQLEAIPFDFDAATKDPLALAGDYYGTYETKALAGLKRVIIPNFQVRFCLSDDVARTSSYSGGGMSFTTTTSAGVTVDLPAEVRQKLVDDLYQRVVARLTAMGVEVVPIPRDSAIPEVQAGIKEMPANGTVEDLTVLQQRVPKAEFKDKGKWFYPWALHQPTQVTGLAYSGVSEGLPPFQSWLREAEMPQMPWCTMAVGKAMGTGILTLGFEVRLEKLMFEKGFFMTEGDALKAKPTLRVRLLSLKAVPDDGSKRAVAIGMSGGALFAGMNYDGLGIAPVATVFGSAKHGDFPWIELDGSYGPVVGTETKGRWLLKPEPEALLADFRKLTDAQLSMLFALVAKSKGAATAP